MKKAVQIGAGNIGRGLNGYILSKNNYHITFLDVSESAVSKINTQKEYKIIQKSDFEIIDLIKNYKAINIIKETQKSAIEIAEADTVFISIGIDNLPKLKSLLISAFKYRMKKNIENKINIVAVENGINATSFLRKIVFKDLDENIKKHIENSIGFVNCAVDRIVPNQENDSLDVIVEPFYEIVLDEKTWIGKKLEYVKYSNFLDKYIQRKLFMLNATHAFIAWYGIKNKYKYIYEFINDDKAYKKVQDLLKNFSDILVSEFDFTQNELSDYSKKIIQRLSNKNIKDLVTRVGRGVIRKVSSQDRFITPIKYAIKNNIQYKDIIKCLCYAFSGIDFDDLEIKEINKYINNNSVVKAVVHFTSLDNITATLIAEEVNKI